MNLLLYSLALLNLANASENTTKRQLPSSGYSWTNAKINGGGLITGLIFNPTNPTLKYARTDIGGAYRWNPRMKRWTPMTDIFGPGEADLMGVHSIATDPKNDKRVYAAVGAYSQSWAGNGAILSSQDFGQSWTIWKAPFKFGANEHGRTRGEALAVNPYWNQHLLLGTLNDGLWQSKDFGKTFSQVASHPVFKSSDTAKGVTNVKFDPTTYGKVVYTAVDDLKTPLFISSDHGETWGPMPGAPTGLIPHHMEFSADGKFLYISFSNTIGPIDGETGRVYKYDVTAKTFTDISPVALKDQYFAYGGLATDPKDPNVIVVSSMNKWAPGSSLYRTTDGGKTWVDLFVGADVQVSGNEFLNNLSEGSDATPGWWIGDVEIDPENTNVIWYGTGATVYRIDDVNAFYTTGKVTIKPQAQGIEETSVLDIAVPSSLRVGGPRLIAAIGDINGLTWTNVNQSPAHGTWTNPDLATSRSVNLCPFNNNLVVRVGNARNDQPTGALSVDGGMTWKPFGSSPSGATGGGVVAYGADCKTIVWNPSGAATSFSADSGATWTSSAGLPGPLAVYADAADGNLFYAFDHTEDGTLYISRDAARTFTIQSKGITPNSVKFGAYYGSPKMHGHLAISSWYGLHLSYDAGKTWRKATGVNNANSFGFGAPSSPNQAADIYVSGNVNGVTGLFASSDAGSSWKRIDSDKQRWGSNQVIHGDPNVGGKVYVGTNGRGLLIGTPK